MESLIPLAALAGGFRGVAECRLASRFEIFFLSLPFKLRDFGSKLVVIVIDLLKLFLKTILRLAFLFLGQDDL
jgi:hypothetical protein